MMKVQSVPEARKLFRYWESRLFKNTYTRHGELHSLKGWSVKIQYQGRRRTFNLVSACKADAAQEALGIYQRILTKGWDGSESENLSHRASIRLASGPRHHDEFSKGDVRYWQARLIDRNYPGLWDRTAKAKSSARISHEGRSAWFPLLTDEREIAAAKALQIYRTITEEGWEAGCRQFSREVTVAIHWMTNPLAWTYTTFHTEISNRFLTGAHRAPKGKRALAVAVIEPDRSIRAALRRCVDAQEGFQCVLACSGTEKAFRNKPTNQRLLWLVDRASREIAGIECLQELEKLAPNSCGLLYSVYEDSEQLFVSTPGGAAAYLLKRTPPAKLLEPLEELSRKGIISGKEISFFTQQYFQKAISSAQSAESMRHLESLTRREQEILDLLGKAYLDKEIADRLGISAWTVHGHVKNIFGKLKVHTRTEAVVKFLQK
jgi:DNA-binding NarL/FixJ family response regulator